MLTPEQLAQIADHATVRRLYDQLQEDIITDMARRISKMDFASYTTMWQLQKLEAINAERDYIVQRLAEISGKSKAEIRAVLETGCASALGADDQIYRLAGYKPTPLSENAALQDVLKAGLDKTLGTFQNLTRTTANTATRQFEDALDRAYMQVTSGGMDYQRAIKGAVLDLSEQGLATIRYPTGHTDYMDVAVRRAVLTGVNQTALKVQDARADELGCDLVEVTAHAGARPSHAEWQGRVYSRSGRDRNYKNFAEATGYGTGEGLGGWNCRHSWFPFFKGLSRQNYSLQELNRLKRQTVDYNGRKLSLYDATQQQRANEREIRALKREQAGLEGAGLDASEVKAKLRDAQARQRDFCEQTGLRRDYFRERGGKQNQQQSPNQKIRIVQQAKNTGAATTSRTATKDLSQVDASGFPSLFTESARVKKQTTAFADYLNTIDNADPTVRRIYAGFGKLDNLPASVKAKVSYTKDGHAVNTSWYRLDGRLADVTVKIPDVSYNGDITGAAQTTAHELGHYIDFLCREDPQKAAGWITTKSADLMNAVRREHTVPDEIKSLFKTTDEKVRKVGADIVAESRGKLDALRDSWYNGGMSFKDYQKARSKIVSEAELLTDRAQRNTSNGVNQLEDIYDALVGGSRPGMYGHGYDYYKSYNNRVQEIWANYCSLSLTRPDLIDALRKHEPELVRALDNVAAEIEKRIV